MKTKKIKKTLPPHPMEALLRSERLPHMWCPGCGIGTVFSSLIAAVQKSGYDPDKTAVVSGIGNPDISRQVHRNAARHVKLAVPAAGAPRGNGQPRRNAARGRTTAYHGRCHRHRSTRPARAWRRTRRPQGIYARSARLRHRERLTARRDVANARSGVRVGRVAVAHRPVAGPAAAGRQPTHRIRTRRPTEKPHPGIRLTRLR